MSELPEKLDENSIGKMLVQWLFSKKKDDPNVIAAKKLNAEIVRRYNAFEGDQKKIKDLLAACKYAKSQIKNGSPKKALPILRNVIAAAKKGNK